MKLTKKALIRAAEELNEVLGLEPEIDVSADEKTIKAMIAEAAGLIEEGDNISDETIDVIEAVLAEREAEKNLNKSRIDEPVDEDMGDDEDETLPKKSKEKKPKSDEKTGKKSGGSGKDKATATEVPETSPVEPETEAGPETKKGKTKTKSEKKKSQVTAKETEPAPASETDDKEKSKPKRKRGPASGIIAAIAEIIEAAGPNGVTKEEIFDQLRERYPDRSIYALVNTINTIVPARMHRFASFRVERIKVEKLPGWRYRKAES